MRKRERSDDADDGPKTSCGRKQCDQEKQMVAQTPLGRIGQPEDIAPVAVFLASADSGWVTGEIIAASGGYR